MKQYHKVLIFGIIFCGYLLFSSSIEAQNNQNQTVRGQVVAILAEETLRGIDIVEQKVLIELKDEQRSTIEITNYYDQYYPFSFDLTIGMNLILKSENGDYYIENVVREHGIFYLSIVGLVLMIIIARRKGFKTLLSLIITFLLIAFFLLPQILAGRNPIYFSVLTSILIVIVSMFLICGINLKSLIALIGTLAGLVFAGILAVWAGNIAFLTGFSSEEAQVLRYFDITLDLQGILFAGIIIGTLGAITDVGISVSSAAFEIKQSNSKISKQKLFKGAMNVGRDVLGTMANTLILAYLGTAMPLLLLVISFEMTASNILNHDLIATEIIRSLIGVIGLLIAVPVTAFCSSVFLTKNSNHQES